MFSSKVVVPSDGSAIVIDDNGKLIVPDNPIVPLSVVMELVLISPL